MPPLFDAVFYEDDAEGDRRALVAHADVRFDAVGDVLIAPSPDAALWIYSVQHYRVEPGDLQVLVHAQVRDEEPLTGASYSCALHVAQSGVRVPRDPPTPAAVP